MTQTTICYGKGEIVPHRKGGWAVPGGGRTLSRAKALELAVEIDKLCGGKADDYRALSIMDEVHG